MYSRHGQLKRPRVWRVGQILRVGPFGNRPRLDGRALGVLRVTPCLADPLYSPLSSIELVYRDTFLVLYVICIYREVGLGLDTWFDPGCSLQHARSQTGIGYLVLFYNSSGDSYI